MHDLSKALILVFSLFILLSCKKETSPIDTHEPYVAPCDIVEEVLEIDTIIYGPSERFPHATLRILFIDTTLEFAFNKVPPTGAYHLVTPMSLGDLSLENQVAIANSYGSFEMYSMFSDSAEIYIDNYNSELIISHCELPNGGNYSYNGGLGAYLGNPEGKHRFRMKY